MPRPAADARAAMSSSSSRKRRIEEVMASVKPETDLQEVRYDHRLAWFAATAAASPRPFALRIVDFIHHSPSLRLQDDAVARIIAKEAARRRERAGGTAGVAAYLGAEPSSATNPAPVNKTFLRNVIGSVTGHNRRNQEEQCWRQKRLDTRFTGGDGDGEGGGGGGGGGDRSRSRSAEDESRRDDRRLGDTGRERARDRDRTDSGRSRDGGGHGNHSSSERAGSERSSGGQGGSSASADSHANSREEWARLKMASAAAGERLVPHNAAAWGIDTAAMVSTKAKGGEADGGGGSKSHKAKKAKKAKKEEKKRKKEKKKKEKKRKKEKKKKSKKSKKRVPSSSSPSSSSSSGSDSDSDG